MTFHRHSSFTLLFSFFSAIKNNFFLLIILFVNRGSTTTLSKFLFIGALVAISCFILYHILTWWTTKYAVDEDSFHLRSGILSKTEQTIPFRKIQNVQQRAGALHRILKLTSLSFETGMSGEGLKSTVVFPAISLKEAQSLEAQFSKQPLVKEETTTDALQVDSSLFTEESIEPSLLEEPTVATKTIHFIPTYRDLVKASFTSLSFFLFIPIVFSILSKALDLFLLEDQFDEWAAFIWATKWLFAIVLILFIMISLIFGIVRTFLTYGKYEIASDEEKIYLKKGVISQSSFTIKKSRVQAILIKQSFLKRVLKLAEVRLISAGQMGTENEAINSLYPFLPINRAYELITELLPDYQIQQNMKRLPKRSLALRLLRPPYFAVVVALVLYFWDPAYFSLSWWVFASLFFLFTYSLRVIDYYHTYYVTSDEFVQFKTGSLTTELFVTKREKVIEVAIEQSPLQRKFQVVSLRTINRSHPVHNQVVADVPESIRTTFIHWYKQRAKEVQLTTERNIKK